MPAEILQRDRAVRPFQAAENQLVHGAVNGNVDAHRVNAGDDILLQTVHRIPESGRQRAVTMVGDGVAERIRRNRAAVRQRGRRQPQQTRFEQHFEVRRVVSIQEAVHQRRVR